MLTGFIMTCEFSPGLSRCRALILPPEGYRQMPVAAYLGLAECGAVRGPRGRAMAGLPGHTCLSALQLPQAHIQSATSSCWASLPAGTWCTLLHPHIPHSSSPGPPPLPWPFSNLPCYPPQPSQASEGEALQMLDVLVHCRRIGVDDIQRSLPPQRILCSSPAFLPVLPSALPWENRKQGDHWDPSTLHVA